MKSSFWIFLFFFLFPISFFGQLNPTYSTYYSFENGLPDRVAHDIFKDSNEMIWITTPSGLARFDGKRIYHFSNLEISTVDQKIDIGGYGKIYEDQNQNLIIHPFNHFDSLEILNLRP